MKGNERYELKLHDTLYLLPEDMLGIIYGENEFASYSISCAGFIYVQAQK